MAQPWEQIPTTVLDDEDRQVKADDWATEQRGKVAAQWGDLQRQQLMQMTARAAPTTPSINWEKAVPYQSAQDAREGASWAATPQDGVRTTGIAPKKPGDADLTKVASAPEDGVSSGDPYQAPMGPWPNAVASGVRGMVTGTVAGDLPEWSPEMDLPGRAARGNVGAAAEMTAVPNRVGKGLALNALGGPSLLDQARTGTDPSGEAILTRAGIPGGAARDIGGRVIDAAADWRNALFPAAGAGGIAENMLGMPAMAALGGYAGGEVGQRVAGDGGRAVGELAGGLAGGGLGAHAFSPEAVARSRRLGIVAGEGGPAAEAASQAAVPGAERAVAAEGGNLPSLAQTPRAAAAPLYQAEPGAKRTYTGTGAAYDATDITKANPEGLYGPAHYSTDSPVLAESYTTTAASGPFARQIPAIRGALSKAESVLSDPAVSQSERQVAASDVARYRESLGGVLDGSGVSPNIRPVDIPPSVKLLDVEAPLDEALVARARASIDQLARGEPNADQIRGQFERGLQSLPDWSKGGYFPATNQNLYDAVTAAMSVSAPVADAGIAAKEATNKALGAMGYDGVQYAGGRIRPMMDASGQPIEHTAYAIFPDALSKIRNALTGAEGGAIAPELALHAGSTVAGGAAGYATQDPQQPGESDADYAQRVALATAGGAAVGFGVGGMATRAGREALARFGRGAQDRGLVPGLSLSEEANIPPGDFSARMEAAQNQAMRDRNAGKVRPNTPRSTEGQSSDAAYAKWYAAQHAETNGLTGPADVDAFEKYLTANHGDLFTAYGNDAMAMPYGVTKTLEEEWLAARAELTPPAAAGPVAPPGGRGGLLDRFGNPKAGVGAAFEPPYSEAERDATIRAQAAAGPPVDSTGASAPQPDFSAEWDALGSASRRAEDPVVSGLRDRMTADPGAAAPPGGQPLGYEPSPANSNERVGGTLGKGPPPQGTVANIPIAQGESDWGRFLRAAIYSGGLSSPIILGKMALAAPTEIAFYNAQNAAMAMARLRLSEATLPALAQAASLPKVAENVWQMLRHGVPAAAEGQLGYSTKGFANPIMDNAATVLGMPSRVHAALTEIPRTVVSEGEKARLAAMQANNLGLKGDAFWEHYQGLRDGSLPGADVVQSLADRAGEFASYRNPMGSLANKLADLQKTPYYGPFLARFVKTPANITARGVDRSPLGIIGTGADVLAGKYSLPGSVFGNSPEFLARHPELQPLARRLVNNAAGLALTVGAAQAVGAGALVGEGPPVGDPSHKAWLQSHTPNALYGIPFRKFPGGVGVALNAFAHYGDYLLYGRPIDSAIEAGKRQLEDGATSQLSQIGMLFFGSQFEKERAISGYIGSFEPMGAALNTVAANTDPEGVRRQTSGVGLTTEQRVLNQLKSGIPGLRETLPVATDVTGRPIPEARAGLGMVNPLSSAPKGDNPTLKAVNDLGLSVGLATHYTANGTRVDFTQDEQNKLKALAFPILEKRIAPMLTSPSFQGQPKTQQAKLIKAAAATAHKEAAERFLGSPDGQVALTRGIAAARELRNRDAAIRATERTPVLAGR